MRVSPLAAWHAARGASFGDGGEVAAYGDAAAEYRATVDAVGLFDACGRDRLLLAGPDRLALVQGLCTNDVEKLPVGHALEAAFITPKGKLVADVRLVKLDDALLFDLEAGRAAALEEQVGRYRIHEDAPWIDAAEALAVLELWGPKAAAALGLAALADGEGAAVTVADASFAAVGTAFGAVLYVPADAALVVAEGLLTRLAGLGGRLVGRAAVEPRRLELGLGRYGLDWDENTNPLEAGLDRALDYKKGCYVGQEVVAKATYIGHVNRRLVRLEWSGTPVERGTPLVAGRTPGRLTSVAPVPGTDRVVALGVVRRESAAAGSRVRVATDAGPEATVQGYPFRSKDKPV